MQNQPAFGAPAAGPSPAEPAEPMKRCPTCGLTFAQPLAHCPDDHTPLEATVSDPMIGTVLAGAYRLTRMIAAGGMGRVYEAVHVRLDRKLVVKVLLESHAFKPEVLERAAREAQAIARIQSEHVVQVVDVLRSPDGRPSVVVDFLEGEDLGARLDRERKLPVHEAVAIARQVCAGVAAAHAAGVVHRDLKPSNVFLVPRPEGVVAKILDFGVAKIEGSQNLTETGALVGTPAYMAPEQAMGADKVDGRADVYAIAALLYHMLTGSPPYGEDDATATLMRLLSGDPPRARSIDKSVPEELEAVLEHAMARDPQQRTPTATQLSEELARFGGDRSVATSSPAAPAPARRVATARWKRPLAVVLTLMAGLLSSAWGAAFSGTVVLAAIAPEEPSDLLKAVVFVATALLGVVVMVLGGRAVVLRWRSMPKIEAYLGALGRAVLSAFAVAAVVELFALAHRAVTFATAPTAHEEHAVALGLAAMVAVAVFAIARRRG